MFTWKYLDIDAGEIDRVKDLCIKELETNPLKPNYFQSRRFGIDHFLDMPVTNTAFIYLNGNASGEIHEDFRPGGQVLALIIPLINCENSITSIYEAIVGPITRSTHEGKLYKYYGPSTCLKRDQYSLSKPVLLNVSLPHRVFNLSNDPRIALSITFKDDPWHLT